MLHNIQGVHHITAIAGDPQKNFDFYTLVLGLRIVKLTVNFDDPGTYHFYFGDATGSPGSLLTFFPWSRAQRGEVGFGQVSNVAFLVPTGSLGFWQKHLKENGVNETKIFTRFHEEVLTFTDADGLTVELVEREGAQSLPYWSGGPIGEEHALRGLAEPTLLSTDIRKTAGFLIDTFGLKNTARAGSRFRFTSSGIGFGTSVDVLLNPDLARGKMGTGVIHHLAWRANSDQELDQWRSALTDHVFKVSPVQDRNYFKSIYFREPGGILYEIATDEPGFTLDEPQAKLGTDLKLPPWLAARRQMLVGVLPPLYWQNGVSIFQK